MGEVVTGCLEIRIGVNNHDINGCIWSDISIEFLLHMNHSLWLRMLVFGLLGSMCLNTSAIP